MELSVIFNPDEFLLDTLLLFLVLSVEIVNVHNVDTQIYLWVLFVDVSINATNYFRYRKCSEKQQWYGVQ